MDEIERHRLWDQDQEGATFHHRTCLSAISFRERSIGYHGTCLRLFGVACLSAEHEFRKGLRRVRRSFLRLRIVVEEESRKTRLESVVEGGFAGKNRDFFAIEVGDAKSVGIDWEA